jgi:hypothetical protein
MAGHIEWKTRIHSLFIDGLYCSVLHYNKISKPLSTPSYPTTLQASSTFITLITPFHSLPRSSMLPPSLPHSTKNTLSPHCISPQSQELLKSPRPFDTPRLFKPLDHKPHIIHTLLTNLTYLYLPSTYNPCPFPRFFTQNLFDLVIGYIHAGDNI